MNENLIPLLEATVIFDGLNVSVSIKKIHPESPDYEYIKLVSMAYAKLLVNIDPNAGSAKFQANYIISLMQRIANADVTKEADILKILSLEEIIHIKKMDKGEYPYTLTLYAVSGIQRHISTDIPVNKPDEQELLLLPVLIQGVIEYLSDDDIKLMQKVLGSMSAKYSLGTDYSNLQSWAILPNATFFEAMSSS